MTKLQNKLHKINIKMENIKIKIWRFCRIMIQNINNYNSVLFIK